MTSRREQDEPGTAKKPAQTIAAQSFEGDYRPSSPAPQLSGTVRIDPVQTEFLMRLANTLNTTLDLQTLMHRTADLVRAVIDYKIFAILLLNERTNDLRMRFQIGHTAETERLKHPHGHRGLPAGRRNTVNPSCWRMSATEKNYISANPDVRSELAVPLIVKNRVIGVMDLQSEQVGYFQPEHRRLLGADRLPRRPGHRERAPLHPRGAAGANPGRAERNCPRGHLDPGPRSPAGAHRRVAAQTDRLPDVQHPAAE